MEKVTISEKQEQTINEFKNALAGFSEDVLAEVIRGNYRVEEKYEVGDFVTIVAKNSKEGKTFELIGKRDEGVYLLKMSPTSNMLWHIEEFRHATPEEIKAEQERKVWAGIGREVKEFKPRDFVEIEHELGFRIHDERQTKVAKAKYDDGKVVGFYPVESFISFTQEDSQCQ